MGGLFVQPITDTNTDTNTFGITAMGQQEVVLVTANGYGSTGTRITRFSTVEVDVGDDLTVTQSATDGDSVTVNTTGIYAIMATGAFTSANRDFGVSINNTTGSDNISALASSKVACMSRTDPGVANIAQLNGVTRHLTAGDVLRHQTDGVTHTAGALFNRLVVVRVA